MKYFSICKQSLWHFICCQHHISSGISIKRKITQEEQKKFIGNAVEVNKARVLCEALVAKLYELNIVPQRFAA